jgi:Tol biopolymer transport system component
MVGETVSHYRVIRKVGGGGMGVVYEAVDHQLGRRVAIKFLSSEIPCDSQAVARLRREAHAASALNHPNICTVHELGEHEGQPFIVFELLEGCTLSAMQAGHPLPLATILELGGQIASALEFAHRAGIVHRDVKPSNLFVTQHHHIKVLDFGIAKPQPQRQSLPNGDAAATSSGSELPITQEGVAVGTAPYMSPEQVLGDEVDQRTDIFSFGAVLHEMATGRPAFGGPTRTAVHDAVLHRVPPPPSSLNPAIPATLDAIIAKALEKDRELRYQSAVELRVDLQRLRRDSASGPTAAVSRPPLKPPETRWWARASWTPVAVAALLIATFVIAWIGLRGGGDQDPFASAVPRQLTSARGWETEPAVSPDGSLVAYASDESGNADIWVVGAGGFHTRLTFGPSSDREPAWLPDGNAILFTSDQGGGRSVWKVPWPAGPVSLVVPDAAEPSVSPDGTRIAFARADERASDTRIFVAPLSDVARARRVTTDAGGLWGHWQPAWSPDGLTIAYKAQGSLWTVPANGGRERQLIGDGFRYERPVWSADGNWIYFSTNREGNFAIWRLPARGGAPRRVTLGTGSERLPSVSRDGLRIAYSTLVEDTDLVLRDTVSGHEVVFGSDRIDHMPVFSHDGNTVFFVSDRRSGREELWAVPVEGDQWGSQARPLTEQPGAVSHPTASPDGRFVAYYLVLGNQRDIWVVSVDGGAPIRFTDDPAADIHPDWSPDGRRIAFVSERGGGSHIWVAPVDNGRPAGPALQLTRGPGVEMAPAWSPDGMSVAFVVEPREGAGDVWLVAADGRGEPIRMTAGVAARRVRWDRATGRLLVSGYWGGSSLRLRSVDPVTKADAELQPPIAVARGEYHPDFDISRNGRFLVLSRDDMRDGNIWVLDKAPGRR